MESERIVEDYLYSFKKELSYKAFHGKIRKKRGSVIDKFHHYLRESYDVGYDDGYRNGQNDENQELLVKIMIRMLLYSDLDDVTILKIIDKENDSRYQELLKEVRAKSPILK